MSWTDEICVSCGLCCTSLSLVRITADDLGCLMQGYHVTREQAGGMVRGGPGEFTILMEKTAACPALSSKAGRYVCHAYDHRPGICREYECYILRFAKEWLKQRSENQSVDAGNPFRSARDEEELARQVQTAIQRMRASFFEECVNNQDAAGFRRPDYMPALMHALAGGEFENSFPPPRNPATAGSTVDGSASSEPI